MIKEIIMSNYTFEVLGYDIVAKLGKKTVAVICINTLNVDFCSSLSISEKNELFKLLSDRAKSSNYLLNDFALLAKPSCKVCNGEKWGVTPYCQDCVPEREFKRTRWVTNDQ